MSPLENDPIRNLPLVTEPRREVRPAATWQVLLTVFGLIAIVSVFFWGISNQRDETAPEQTTATTQTPATPQGGDTQQGQDQAQQPQQPSSTTGQGGGEDKTNEKDQPQKVNGAPAGSDGQQRQSK